MTLGIAASLLVAGVPVLVLRFRYGAEWRWFGLGISSWLLALLLKATIFALATSTEWSPAAAGSLEGLLSASAELGMAALFLWRRTLSGPNVLAFGTGIGAFEVFFVLGLAGIELAADQGASVTGGAALFFVLERAITLVGHASSRVLIYVALRKRWLLPAGLALVLFAVVDGTAAYGEAAGWDWEDHEVRGLFTVFLAAVGLLEAAAAWWCWRLHRPSRNP